MPKFALDCEKIRLTNKKIGYDKYVSYMMMMPIRDHNENVSYFLMQDFKDRMRTLHKITFEVRRDYTTIDDKEFKEFALGFIPKGEKSFFFLELTTTMLSENDSDILGKYLGKGYYLPTNMNDLNFVYSKIFTFLDSIIHPLMYGKNYILVPVLHEDIQRNITLRPPTKMYGRNVFEKLLNINIGGDNDIEVKMYDEGREHGLFVRG